MKKHFLVALLVSSLCAVPAVADNKVTNKAKTAVDPDCSVQKATKGAAMKATVGVGNRCGAAETARDVTGVDGKGKSIKKKVTN